MRVGINVPFSSDSNRPFTRVKVIQKYWLPNKCYSLGMVSRFRYAGKVS